MRAYSLLRSVLNAFFRVIIFMIGAGHIVGYFGYAQYYNPWIVVPGIILLALSMTSFSWIKRNFYFFILVNLIIALSYFLGGLPFLDERHDAIARFILFAEFIGLLIFFIVMVGIWFCEKGINKK